MTMAGNVDTDTRSLSWDHGEVSVSAFGGMIGPSIFRLRDGRTVSPFHVAPWLNEAGAVDLDGLLAGLQGEWPCVPFGYPMPAPEWPVGWPGQIEDQAHVADVHGFSSAAQWTFDDCSDGSISLGIDYPADHAIARLDRNVRPDRNAAALDISLTIHARRATCEPIGLHGCFRLPPMTAGAVLEPGAFAIGRTHPLTVEPAAPIFAQELTFDRLSEVAARGGGQIDASRLPFAADGEDLLQLDGSDGHFAMSVLDEAYRVTFDWDADILPSVLLWYSNRGRAFAPWNGRHLCIGIEPICSPFGLSPQMARADNPIAASGTPTCVPLTPNNPLTIRYRIGVKDIA